MPEVRVTISRRLNEILDKLVETGLFTSKADIMRYATITYLKELKWIGEVEKLLRRNVKQHAHVEA